MEPPHASPRPLPPLWRAVEAYFERAYATCPLEGDRTALLAYNLFQHSSPEISLADGTRIRPGDTLMEIHFQRAALAPLAADGDPLRMGLGILKLADRDMPRLARALAEDPGLQSVRALHALTLFHAGLKRYGFEPMPLEPWWRERWFTWWQRRLLARDHASGAAYVRQNADRLLCRHVWLSREALMARYRGEAARKTGSTAGDANRGR